MQLIRIALAFIAVTLPATFSQAAVYDWTYSNGTDVGSGTLTTDDGNPAALMTDITGTFDALSITGVVAPGDYFNDNKIVSPDPYLTINGIAFYAGDNTYDIYYYDSDNPGYYTHGDPTNAAEPDVAGTFTLTPASIPEPMSLALLGLGVTGVAVARRRQTPVG